MRTLNRLVMMVVLGVLFVGYTRGSVSGTDWGLAVLIYSGFIVTDLEREARND